MKRVTYISRFSRELTRDEVRTIGADSQRNNLRDDITGVLISSSGVFFQIIEGEDEKVDRLYAKIKQDRRHKDVLCLKTETDIAERQFPKWSMQTLNLDENTDILMRPIRSLFQVLAESHGVLEKYTQPTVLKLINDGLNPLLVPSRETQKIVFFGDIVAFSYFSSILSVQEIVSMVETYLTICAEAIVERGGEVAKYIGDCVMAYFDFDKVEGAIQAGLDILGELERRRGESPPDSPVRFLYSGIGIACGKVIEGNIGSRQKREYTILGDCVNQAAYLESLTRNLPRSLALSFQVKEMASSRWSFLNMGEYSMKRAQGLLPVYSIDHPLTQKPKDPPEIIREVNQSLERQILMKHQTGR